MSHPEAEDSDSTVVADDSDHFDPLHPLFEPSKRQRQSTQKNMSLRVPGTDSNQEAKRITEQGGMKDIRMERVIYAMYIFFFLLQLAMSSYLMGHLPKHSL